MDIQSYLIYRFKYNNHNKYLKYMNNWINNVTENQLQYFKLEKERLGL
jgi:hypothetical protein